MAISKAKTTPGTAPETPGTDPEPTPGAATVTLILVQPHNRFPGGVLRDMVEPFERIAIPVGKWTPVPETNWVTGQLAAGLLIRK